MGVCQSQVSHSVEDQVVQCVTAVNAREAKDDSKLLLQKISPLVYISKKDLDQSLKLSSNNEELVDEAKQNLGSKSPAQFYSQVQTSQNSLASTCHVDAAVVSVPTVEGMTTPAKSAPAIRQGETTYVMQCGDILKEVPLLDLPGSGSSLLARRRLTAKKL